MLKKDSNSYEKLNDILINQHNDTHHETVIIEE